MASQRRSIWEIRFYALQEKIQREKKHIKQIIAHKVLSDSLNQDDASNANMRIELLDNLLSDSRNFETRKAAGLYLERDN